MWPPGAGLQGQAPNHPMPLRLKDVVVSDGEKADVIRQVSDGKMSESESPLTHRKGFQSLSKRVEVADARNSVRHLLTVHMAADLALCASLRLQAT